MPQEGLQNPKGPALIPAGFFGMVLGTVGMGSAWRFAAHHWALPTIVGEIMLLGGAMVWLVLACAFVHKWLFHREAALAEAHHPIQGCFISLFPGTAMLTGMAVAPYAHPVGMGLVLLGTLFQLVFAAWRSAGLWLGRHSPEATTPALYLPTVAGNFISAITLGNLGFGQWGMLFFGAGFFSWISLESAALARLRSLGELPVALRPSLGIQIAPPLVACTAYLAVNGGVGDAFAQALFGYGLLQLIFVPRLLPWIFAQPFSPAFWSFSFGASALSSSALHFARHAPDSPIALLCWPLFVLSNVVIGLLLAGTLVRIAQGRFLPR